ncbi:MAG: biopolymer transporter ExbD [Rhodocyclaceae bacterium]
MLVYNANHSHLQPQINRVPPIDAMLVLPIIFMVTAPLLTHAVKVDLPKAASMANLTKPDNGQLAIDAASQVLWNGEAVNTEQFAERLKAARQGLVRIGFVTDPTTQRSYQHLFSWC